MQKKLLCFAGKQLQRLVLVYWFLHVQLFDFTRETVYWLAIRQSHYEFVYIFLIDLVVMLSKTKLWDGITQSFTIVRIYFLISTHFSRSKKQNIAVSFPKIYLNKKKWNYCYYYQRDKNWIAQGCGTTGKSRSRVSDSSMKLSTSPPAPTLTLWILVRWLQNGRGASEVRRL